MPTLRSHHQHYLFAKAHRASRTPSQVLNVPYAHLLTVGFLNGKRAAEAVAHAQALQNVRDSKPTSHLLVNEATHDAQHVTSSLWSLSLTPLPLFSRYFPSGV